MLMSEVALEAQAADKCIYWLVGSRTAPHALPEHLKQVCSRLLQHLTAGLSCEGLLLDEARSEPRHEKAL